MGWVGHAGSACFFEIEIAYTRLAFLASRFIKSCSQLALDAHLVKTELSSLSTNTPSSSLLPVTEYFF
jgi:hypothetical protein